MFLALYIFLVIQSGINCENKDSFIKLVDLINDYEDCLVIIYFPNTKSIKYSELKNSIMNQISIPLFIAPSNNTRRKSYNGIQKFGSTFCLVNFYIGPSLYCGKKPYDLRFFVRYVYTKTFAVSRKLISHVFTWKKTFLKIKYKILKRMFALYIHKIRSPLNFDGIKQTTLLMHFVNKPLVTCKESLRNFNGICTIKSRKIYEDEVNALSDNGKTYYYDGCNSSNWKSNCINIKHYPVNKLKHPFDLKYLKKLVEKNEDESQTMYETIIHLLILNTVNVIAQKLVNGNINHPNLLLNHLKPIIPEPNIQKWNGNEYIVVTGETYMKFITCYGVTQPLSFTFYFEPYSVTLWILYLLFLLIIIPFYVSLFITFESNVQNGSKNFLNTFGHVSFVSYAVSFEISPFIHEKFQRIQQHFRSQVLLTCWYLLVAVLVNGYKGIITNHLILGPEIHGTIKDLSQLDNWILIGNYEFLNRLLFFTQSINERVLTNKSSSSRVVKTYRGIEGCMCNNKFDWEELKSFCKKHEENKLEYENSASEMNRTTLKNRQNNFFRNLEKVSLNFTLSSQITNCSIAKEDLIFEKFEQYYIPCKERMLEHLKSNVNDVEVVNKACSTETITVETLNKTVINPDWPSIKITAIENQNFLDIHANQSCKKIAFIDFNDKIKLYEAFSKYSSDLKSHTYRKGTTKIFNTWEIIGSPLILFKISNVYKNLLYLVEFGILELWKNACEQLDREAELFNAEDGSYMETQPFSPIGICGNLSTIFCLYIALIILTILYFLIFENKGKICKFY